MRRMRLRERAREKERDYVYKALAGRSFGLDISPSSFPTKGEEKEINIPFYFLSSLAFKLVIPQTVIKTGHEQKASFNNFVLKNIYIFNL
jgi:hypothetical protein